MRLLFIPVFFVTFLLPAQEPLNPPSPLVANQEGVVLSAGEQVVSLAAAQRAQALGFPAVAAELYRRLLEQSEGNRAALTIALVTALLDEGRIEEADQALRGMDGGRDAAWRLRSALIAAHRREYDVVREGIADLKPEDFVPADRSWFFFLQGVLADAAGDLNRSRGYYEQAESAAVSEMARVRFLLAREETRLRAGAADNALLEEARRNMERMQGRKAGYGFARTYAVMLDTLGRKGDAVAELQRQLLALPPEEKAEADDFRMLLGLIAGPESGAGRHALQTLLTHGADRNKQRIALLALTRALGQESARDAFFRELDLLIGRVEPHPIREELLLVRAQLALAGKNYEQAEKDARDLIDEFPGSQLKSHALGVLTSSAWEQRRYRNAADQAARAAAEAPAGQFRAELRLLVAESWFRARDYQSAAAAYAAALREVPAGVAPGGLMFQSVLAEIRANRLDEAQRRLDEYSADPAFDAINRWQTEWNLARALQVAGQTAAAYTRINNLLGGASGVAGALAPDLRARMAWLQARLSYEAGQPERTLELVEALAGQVAGVEAGVEAEILSSGMLLRAEANFALGRDEAALTALKQLREQHPRSNAAVYSYIVEADHHAQRDQMVVAQRLLTELADTFPGNTYAPYSLYQAALLAERRGQDANLEEANKLIEKLVRDYPRSEYVFYARLKQGDLLRKLNQFPQAQQVYESLLNNFPRHEDVVLAQLALAACHHAQALRDDSHAERALTLFEQLRDRVDAPIDVRVEAGFNLGHLYARRGQPGQAEVVWWRDVVTEFLLDEVRAAQLGANGRYWMARTLLELGGLYEQQAKLDQAQEAWRLVLKTGLPGAALARQSLGRYNPDEAKP